VWRYLVIDKGCFDRDPWYHLKATSQADWHPTEEAACKAEAVISKGDPRTYLQGHMAVTPVRFMTYARFPVRDGYIVATDAQDIPELGRMFIGESILTHPDLPPKEHK